MPPITETVGEIAEAVAAVSENSIVDAAAEIIGAGAAVVAAKQTDDPTDDEIAEKAFAAVVAKHGGIAVANLVMSILDWEAANGQSFLARVDNLHERIFGK